MIMHLMERAPSSKIRPLCYTTEVTDVVYTRSLYRFVQALIDRDLGRAEQPHGCQACKSLVW